MSKEAFDKISAGLRDAIAGNISRVHIDGVTWVRHDAGSPEAHLMSARSKIAELTERVDVLEAERRAIEHNQAASRSKTDAERISELERALDDCAAPFVIGNQDAIDYEAIAREFSRRQHVARAALSAYRSKEG